MYSTSLVFSAGSYCSLPGAAGIQWVCPHDHGHADGGPLGFNLKCSVEHFKLHRHGRGRTSRRGYSALGGNVATGQPELSSCAVRRGAASGQSAGGDFARRRAGLRPVWRLAERLAVSAVVVAGLGYVGLPLAMRAAAAGHQVAGYDTDAGPGEAAGGRGILR